MSLVAAPGDLEAWHAWRAEGVGASDVAAILGLSNWGSAWAVWAEKVGLIEPERDLDDDDPREFGRRAEAMIAPWFTDKTGLHVVASQLWAQHDTYPWMKATPDGGVSETPRLILPASRLDPDLFLGGLEIKVDFGRPWHDGIPIYYKTQGQWQMACTGWERVWFAVLHGRKLRIYELERSEADIAFMIDAVGTFWTEHVVAGVPPPLDDSEATSKALERLYPEHRPGLKVDLTASAQWIDALKAAKADEAAAKRRVERARSEILNALGEGEIGMVGGFQALTFRSGVRRSTCKHCLVTDVSEPFRTLRLSSYNPKEK